MHGMLHAAIAIVAAAVFLNPTAAHADLTAIEAAAKKEGEVSWYSSSNDSKTAEAIGQAFTKKYGIKVNVFSTTAQNGYQRLVQELKSNAVQCDVYTSSDAGHFVPLKAQKALAHYVPTESIKLSKDFLNYDKEGYVYPTGASMVLITYNNKNVPAADAPKNWADLYDPKWKDQVSLGHAGFSGYAGAWAVLMNKLYGWEFFEKLKKNNPQISRSINDTTNILNSGERKIAIGGRASTLLGINRGNPITLVYPEDGALLMISASAVVDKAPHPNAARLFMEYLMGVEYNEVVTKDYNDPLRPEVALPTGMKSISEIKINRLSMEEISTLPEIIKKWRDTLGD